ncbi:MAG: DNA/RNA nuclease SfsA, partial [Atribacterota bacterium]|nr:DNA/RNA nuclease SfsA [Atribacterota bacterium]
MKYNEVVPAVFIERINRFLAKVLVGGKFEMVHVRNSGRC